MHKTSAQPRAFTLFELVLVMLIIAIVVGTVAPKLSGFTAGRTSRNTATRLLAMTNYARTQAISEGRIYRLNFSPDKREFWLAFADGRDVPSDLGDPLVIDQRLSVRVDNMSAGENKEQYIDFEPSGRCSPASIVIVDPSNVEIEIACSSATEMFRILTEEERTR